MALTCYPLDAVTGAPSYTGRKLRQTLGALFGGKQSTRPLGARSGVTAGCGDCSSISGTTYTIKPHTGILDVETGSTVGPYAYAVDANITGTTTAADATNPRIDILCIKLDDPAEDASSTPQVTLAYTNGTAAASPSAPATPARSLKLAEITVPASGGGNPSISWVADTAIAAGGILPSSDTLAPANPHVGQYIHDTSNRLRWWDGTRYVPRNLGGTKSYSIANGATADNGETVTFAKQFSSAPVVVAQVLTDTQVRHSVRIRTITSTGFTFDVFRTDGVAASGAETGTVQWIAVP